ncbi:MAG: hypothetical protein DMD45_10180 [Gemmatimonadetes bacterium]|nr:MAG: hypothetical protein DMD45_10180 [Gemmatimonadota bacterium]
MKHGTAERIVTWALVATAACSGDSTGPAPTCSSALASQLTLAIGAYSSIDPASDGGCVTFPANASVDSAEYLLVAQSAAGTFGQSSPFALRAAMPSPAPMAVAPLLAEPTAPPSPAVRFDGMLRRLGREHAARAAAAASRRLPGTALRPSPPVAAPPALGSLRRFTVCANETSCGAAADFKTVGARVLAVGAHVAIYVDTLAPAGGLNSADLDTLRQVFDTLLYPLDSATFGAVSDLDANGVVIALMTPVVNSLTTKAACSASGGAYIAGFFFPADLDPSAPTFQTNGGEIFYSIVADPNATLSCAHSATAIKTGTPGTFVHEFQHMINYAQHTLIHTGSTPEEGWLDEGLSKYAEELTARRYLQAGDMGTWNRLVGNDVFDAYQYLRATGASPLLIEVDQGTLAEVGASWLFTRYLVDQYGAALPGRLVQTTLAGAANVAAQTGHGFDTTVTRWALSNWVSDLPGFATPPELSDTSWHFRTRTFASLHQQDPNTFPFAYPLVPTVSAGSAVSLSGTLRSGSGVYGRALQAPGAPAFTLLFSGSGAGALPAAVVPRLTVIRIR